MTEGSYNVVFSRLAARALGERLPAAVAVAAIDFINGPLSDNQQRVGGPLHGELEGAVEAPDEARTEPCTASISRRIRCSFCASPIVVTCTRRRTSAHAFGVGPSLISGVLA